LETVKVKEGPTMLLKTNGYFETLHAYESN